MTENCKEKAHDKVRKAANEGGWAFCPICEVARLTAMLLEQKTMNEEIGRRMDSILTKVRELEKAYRSSSWDQGS